MPAEDERLVDDGDLHAGLHEVVEQLDVLGEQPDAAVARAQTDAGGLVGAVDEVARPIEVERAVAERVVRTRGHHGGQDLAVLLVLGAHAGAGSPRGVLGHAHDAGRPLRRRPTDAPDTDREGVDRLPLAGLARRVVEEPHRREVDDDPLARRVGEYVARRQHDLAALARQPRIHAGIGADELLVADVEAACEVDEGVLARRAGDLQFTDQVAVRGVEHRAVRAGRERRGCVGQRYPRHG